MVNNISWASYLYAISIILIIYYACVLILYYRNDLLKHFLKSKESFNSSSTARISEVGKDVIQVIEPHFNSVEENNSIQEILSNIQTCVATAVSRNFPKEELLLSLQLQLKKVTAVNDSTLKGIVNNYIIAACENYCSIHLTEQEISELWNK